MAPSRRQRRREAERRHQASGYAGVPRHTTPLRLDRLAAVVGAYTRAPNPDVRRELDKLRRAGELER